MKNATENEEFDTMVRILKRNDLCTMASDAPTSERSAAERTSGPFKTTPFSAKSTIVLFPLS